MCMVRVIDMQDDMAFFSEAFSESSDEVGDIAGRLEGGHSIPFVDKHGHFFLCLIENDIADMVLYQFADILLVYLLKNRFDILVHMMKGLKIIFREAFSICQKEISSPFPFFRNPFPSLSGNPNLRISSCFQTGL